MGNKSIRSVNKFSIDNFSIFQNSACLSSFLMLFPLTLHNKHAVSTCTVFFFAQCIFYVVFFKRAIFNIIQQVIATSHSRSPPCYITFFIIFFIVSIFRKFIIQHNISQFVSLLFKRSNYLFHLLNSHLTLIGRYRILSHFKY